MPEAIQLADFKKQWAQVRNACVAAFDRVGESGWLILGREVAAFEDELASWWGLPHAVACGNGLDALEIAFRCAGMQPGDLVLTTPLSAFATTLAILRVGAQPVFSDVDELGLLDLASAEAILRAAPARPRFVVPVHLYGFPMNLEALAAFAARHELTVIEDCAQSIGARWRGEPVGGVGEVCATSFYPTKNLGAFGDGGALLTRSPRVRDLARRLRDYGQSEKYVHDDLGLNSRLDELQAALLRSVQLPALRAQTERRAAIAASYLGGIRNGALQVPRVPSEAVPVWHLFPVLVEGDREQFRSHLSSRGVSSGLHYPRLICDQRAYVSRYSPVAASSLPVAHRFATQQVSIPLHPFLTDAEVTRVIEACNTWSP